MASNVAHRLDLALRLLSGAAHADWLAGHRPLGAAGVGPTWADARHSACQYCVWGAPVYHACHSQHPLAHVLGVGRGDLFRICWALAVALRLERAGCSASDGRLCVVDNRILLDYADALADTPPRAILKEITID